MGFSLKIYFILLMLGCSQIVAADNLQRLFTTAEQRLALEKQRLILPAEPITEEEIVALPKPPEYIAYNGLMRTRQGKLAIWLNGSQELDLVQIGYSIELANDPHNIVIILAYPEQIRFELRPGEILDTENLQVLQAYELMDKKYLTNL